MDSHNRFERRSLRDVLVDQSVLTEELADELMNSAREENEVFGAVVVESGHMTAWDLAKTVAVQYSMPHIPLSGFRYDGALAENVPASTLHQYQVVPVGRFGRARSFAVVEPPTRACITALSEACECSIFFFVAECTEVKRLLMEHVKVVDTSKDSSWQDIFDVANDSIGG